MPPRAAAPTLKAVAKLANVSPSTVSRALRGNPVLSAATITRVRAAAERIGYHANPVISDIMRRVRGRGRLNHLGTIAYLTFHSTPVQWRQSATYRGFYEGALRRAHDLGFSLEPIWAREPDLTANRLTQILKSRGITGVIVGPRPVPVSPDILDWSQFSLASLGVPLPGLQLHLAGSHHARIMERILAALAQRGYQRPGLVLFRPQLSKTEPGWPTTWVYHQHSLPAAKRVPLLALDGLDKRAFQRWHRRHQPDVIVGLQEFLDWAPRLGLEIPRDVAFAHLSRHEGPAEPAGIDQRSPQIGASAVDLVVSQILTDERGVPAHPRFLLIIGDWVDGWSARRAAGDSSHGMSDRYQ